MPLETSAIVEHTPGPWAVYRSKSSFQIWPRARDPQTAPIADAFTLGITLKECEANAQLIAAAPELLGALKEALEIGCGDRRRGHPEWCSVDWHGRAAAAIAKAEGRE